MVTPPAAPAEGVPHCFHAALHGVMVDTSTETCCNCGTVRNRRAHLRFASDHGPFMAIELGPAVYDYWPGVDPARCTGLLNSRGEATR